MSLVLVIWIQAFNRLVPQDHSNDIPEPTLSMILKRCDDPPGVEWVIDCRLLFEKDTETVSPWPQSNTAMDFS